MAIKHVGFVGDQKKVVVVYRTLPGDSSSALITYTGSLNQSYHDDLFSIVDSTSGQQANELAEVLSTRKFSDGNTMLSTLHTTGKLTKVKTSDVTMTPGPQKEGWIKLDELNKIIAEQKGVSVDDLAVQPSSGEVVNEVKEPILSDEDLAAQYRSQADALYKEVQQLRKQADELSPKKSTAKSAKTDA